MLRLTARQGPRLLLFLVSFPASLLIAQSPPSRVPVPAGSTHRAVVEIAKAPLAGDAIVFDVSTQRLRITLVTPDGVRITKQTVKQPGFRWTDRELPPPIGSTDAGAAGSITFLTPGRAGTYVVEFAAPVGVRDASARAVFVAQQDSYLTQMSTLPGFQKLGPLALTPGGNVLECTLDQDEKMVLFDLVTSVGAALSLTVPDGRTIDSSVGKQDSVSWQTLTRTVTDPPNAPFLFEGFLLPVAGTHHAVILDHAPRGKYQVRTVADAVEVTAAFIPVGRLLELNTQSIADRPGTRSGETRIQTYALRDGAMVGENYTAKIRIVGDPIAAPRFVALMEYRQIVSVEPLRYSSPVVERVPIVFTDDGQGLYTGTITPRRPGALRVGLQVSGTKRNGSPFFEETILWETTVHPVVARFLGLTEHAIDEDGNGTLDRWEITAKLDVVVPGEFEMRLSVSSPDHSGLNAEAHKILAVGEQTLTATLSAAEIRARLSDGPWTISAPQIYRPKGNTFGQFVSVPATAVLKGRHRAVWDPGAAHGERTISVRGIRPAASGKFRSFEVLWDVTTPGAACNWRAGLYSSDSVNLSQWVGGRLPAGRVTVSFVFDASLITANPKRTWTLGPDLSCESIVVPAERPLFIKLDVDSSDYEDRKEPFLLFASMERLGPDRGKKMVQFVALGRKASGVEFRVAREMAGLVIEPAGKPFQRDKDAVANYWITAARSLPAGRYYVPVEAEDDAGTATTELVVDIVE